MNRLNILCRCNSLIFYFFPHVEHCVLLVLVVSPLIDLRQSWWTFSSHRRSKTLTWTRNFIEHSDRSSRIFFSCASKTNRHMLFFFYSDGIFHRCGFYWFWFESKRSISLKLRRNFQRTKNTFWTFDRFVDWIHIRFISNVQITFQFIKSTENEENRRISLKNLDESWLSNGLPMIFLFNG